MCPTEPRYDVVWPAAPLHQPDEQSTEGRARKASRLQAGGFRLGFIWDYVFHGDEMFEEIKSALTGKGVDVDFVEYEAFGNIHSHNEDEVIAQLPDVLRREGVDAVVVGVGA
jgi:hypothetical protein